MCVYILNMHVSPFCLCTQVLNFIEELLCVGFSYWDLQLKYAIVVYVEDAACLFVFF